MSEIAEQHADDGLVVLAINAWNEPREKVAAYVSEHDLKHRILLDGKDVVMDYGRAGIPTTFWIDPEGMIRESAEVIGVPFRGDKALARTTERFLQKN